MNKLACCVLFFGVWSRIPAQSVFSSILGSVIDQSGAAVKGAVVTLLEVDTGANVAAVSNAAGLYEFLNIPAGTYEVTASKTGFASNQIRPVSLDPRQTRRVDFHLAVAARADTVTVQAPAIDTAGGAKSDTKTAEELARLPLNFRGAGGTVISTSMVFPGLQQDFYGNGWSLAGGMPVQLEVTVDGISSLYVPFHIPLADIAPSVEITGEMTVTLAGNPAGFGGMGDVTVSSRGGTNQAHGSLFWYAQNGALDAKIYGSPVKPPKVFNTVGASFGGPVVVPGVLNARNRTFFFADFETNLQRNWYLDQFSVPTAGMRAGNLNGVPGPAIADPSTGAPFPGNQIPESRLSGVSRVLLSQFYPAPNYPGDIANNLRYVANNNVTTYGYDIRVDHVLGPRQRIFTRWSWKNMNDVNDWAPLAESPDPIHDRTLVAAQTWTPRADLSNEIRFGFTFAGATEHFPIKGKDAVAALGLQGLDLRNAGDSGGFPTFQFSGSTGFATVGHGRNQFVGGRNYQLSDTISSIRGGHTIQLGAELRRVVSLSALTRGRGDDFGLFTFGDTFTGNDFGDLLLGMPSASTTAVLGPNAEASVNYFNVFVRDNWKLGRRTTLDLGLRMETHPAMSEHSGNMANIDPMTANVILPDHSIAPAPGFLEAVGACAVTSSAPGCTQVLTASQAGLPSGLRRTHAALNPRLGFAWRPLASGKAAIRASIGIYTPTFLGQIGSAMIGIHSSDVRTFNNVSSTGHPLFTFPSVSPSPDALGAIAVTTFRSGVNPDFENPRSYQWSFTTDRELPSHMTVSASYIASQSIGLPERVDLNQVHASTQPFLASSRPFSHWLQLLSIQNLGFSNYQGMILEWTRKSRNGIFFQASYQLGKSLGSLGNVGSLTMPFEASGGSVTDRFDTRYDRGNLPGPRRKRFLLTAIAPLPFGRNRASGNGWSPTLDAFLGGWEFSTIALLESGLFQTPFAPAGRDQSNTDLSNRGLARPDRVIGVNLANPIGDQYYDPAAFTFVPDGAGRFGNSGAGILQGPGSIAVSAGLAKTFHFAEHLRGRVEATFRNIANHPNFLAPVTTLGTPKFGRLLSVQSAENSGNRTGQLGLRLEF